MPRPPSLAVLPALLLLLLLAFAAAPAGAAQERKVGSVTVRPCGGGEEGWCGKVARPLDPAFPSGAKIAIAFKWLPATGGKARGPALVAVEGGPGYPSTGSIFEYITMYGPLLKTRDLLLVDNRGTGRSALLDCPALQSFAGRASGERYAELVGDCARRIDAKYKGGTAPGVHAAGLFTTANAADDLAAILTKLDLGRVDLYGDSYGTWFAQSFIARHPGAVRSVLLDSAYPVRGLDPWYASSGPAFRSALEAVCARDPGCRAATRGAPGPVQRLGELVARLRAKPITGQTTGDDGRRRSARVTVRSLADLVQDSASDPIILRELDAAVRAALAGDRVPLLRLAAYGVPSPDDVRSFSAGAYFAVACTDYPQLYDKAQPPEVRRAQIAAFVATAPDAFAPFTPAEWITVSSQSEPYDACVHWPAGATAPPVPEGAAPLPASVPVLIMGGDLDSLTPLADAKAFGPSLSGHVRVVTLKSSTHITSEGATILTRGAACARGIVRAFVRRPSAMDAIDARCASAIPHVHTPGAYPLRFADVRPAARAAGGDPGSAARRAATVAAGALADAAVRFSITGAGNGPGLRGGYFEVSAGSRIHLRLRDVRFVRDASVDGSGTYAASTGALRGTFSVRVPGRRTPIRVKVSWRQSTPFAHATAGGAALRLPAP